MALPAGLGRGAAAAEATGRAPALAATRIAAFSRPFDISADGVESGEPAFTLTPAPDAVLFLAWSRDGSCVAYSASVDGGLSFFPPALLRVPGYQPAVVNTSAGSLLLATAAADSIRCSRSRNSGLSFLPHSVNVQGIASPANPALAVDAQGQVALAWDVNSTTIYYASSTDDGQSFGVPAALSVSEGAGYQQWRPKLAVDGQRSIYAVWNHARGFGTPENWIKFSRSTNLGVTFSLPVVLSDTLRLAHDPQVIARGAGILDVMWVYSGPTDSVVVSESTNQGASFSRLAAVAMPGGGGTTQFPSFTRGSDGTLHAVVQTYAGGTIDCYYVSLPPGGNTFTTPVNFSNSPGNSQSPVVILDGFGTPIIAWSDLIAGGLDIVLTRKLP